VQAEITRLDINAEAKQRRVARDALDVVFPAATRLDRFLAEPDDDPEWRIEGLWPTGGNILIAAQYKAGKSTLISNALRSFADGAKFLDQYRVQPGRVVLIDDELDPRTLRRWVRDQGIVNTVQVDVVSLRGRTALFDLTVPEVRARWADIIRGADVLIFDCLRPVLDALGLSEDKDAGIFLTGLDALKHEAGIGEAIVVHHMGHSGERARGDSRLKDWPDVTWTIVREDPDDPSSARYFKAYGRDVDLAETALDYDEPTRHLSLGHGNRKDQAASSMLTDLLALLRSRGELNGSELERELLDESHSGRNELRAAIALGVSRGQILTRRGPRNSVIHSLNPVARGWQD
jgi:RecA-family ATPase